MLLCSQHKAVPAFKKISFNQCFLFVFFLIESRIICSVFLHFVSFLPWMITKQLCVPL